ncbi:hypothetical protein TOPH_05379 [Tolypocladium ophioglossoides CBS 100239]|uniref:NmrA-like domain-containing protein n=1 Tax=Tolypocladium ophioglossoides (strain CBS 100239) TaxID=1163406 RepID=A0A0L0N8C3_TOLOC|nr:hypothetical protein TOPH_05379 [Tolypocladium ophioglossoides CBS 100239]
MAQKYAKDQPAGFTNRIERVAIVGVGGQVGSFLTAALLSTGKHTVTAVTRAGSGSTVPPGCKVAAVDYDKEETLVDALRGQQFLLISMSVRAPRDTQSRVIAAAAKAGVPWVMPNCYGTDVQNKPLEAENLTGPGVLGGIEAIEKAGVSSWVAMCCNFWYEYSLSMGEGWYGFDFKNKKATFIDDGNTRINTSTWEQCGRAIKSFLSLKELPDDEHDTSPTISQWRNKPLYISSFLASQRDMLDSLNRVLGTTDADWQIERENSATRYKRGQELLKQGSLLGFGICLYTRTFFPNGDGNFGAKYGLANKTLGLPTEEIDAATKRSLALANGEFDRTPAKLLELFK